MVWFSFLVTAEAAPTGGVLGELWEPPGQEEGPELAPVVGGTEAPAGNDDVVALAFYDQTTELISVFCTGSVIQDDWILTAAHCIDETNVVQGVPGVQRVVVWGENIPLLGAEEIIPWREAYMSPIYNASAFTGDAGLIQLERPHPDPTWVVLRDEPFGLEEVGQSIEVFGYGSTGDGRPDAGVKRTTTLPVEEVDASNIVTFTPASNVCSGDSGGPGFVAAPWGREQVGINAFVTPGCIGGRGGSTRVDVHIDWILDLVPGVALDPSQLPEDEPPVDEDVPGGDRFWTDFGADDPQAFAVDFGEVDPEAAGAGCSTLPGQLSIGALVPLLVVFRRRATRPSAPNKSA